MESFCSRVVGVLSNSHVTFVAASFLALQILVWNPSYPDRAAQLQNDAGTGSGGAGANGTTRAYHRAYSRGAIYRLVLEANKSDVLACTGGAFALHDRSGMPQRQSRLSQKIGDTTVHQIGAYLDDRLDRGSYVRLLGFGLRPVPREHVYCNYVCESRPTAPYCSVRAAMVTVITGTASGHVTDESRTSWMDVYMLSCRVNADDKPHSLWLSTVPCGYSHNTVRVQPFNTRGTVAPPWELGVCVRPLTTKHAVDPGVLSKWLEYLRLLGADHVHIYVSAVSPQIRNVLDYYCREPFSLVSVHNWTDIQVLLDDAATESALINHCLYENMMTYRYVIVTSLSQWLSVGGGGGNNLKALVRSQTFRDKVNEYSGFRIAHSGRDTEYRDSSVIVKALHVLTVAGGYFVPLRHQTYYRVLPRNVIQTYSVCAHSPTCRRMEADLEKLISDKRVNP